MAARRCEISLRVFKYFSTQEEKFRISKRPYNVLFIILEIRVSQNLANSGVGAPQKFSDLVGRGGISRFIGEVKLHDHNDPEFKVERFSFPVAAV